MKDTNPFVQMQTVLLALKRPEILDDDPDLPLYFAGDAFAESAIKAIGTARNRDLPVNVETVAHIMSKQKKGEFKDMTPAAFDKKLELVRNPAWGEPDAHSNAMILRELWKKRSSISLLTDTSRRIELGEDPVHVLAEMNERALEIERQRDMDILSTVDWAVRGPQLAQEQKHTFGANSLMTIPPELEMTARRIKRVKDGILVSLLGRSGAGKTMFAMMWSTWAAMAHGRSVVHLTTEIPVKMLMWRQLCRLVPGLTVDWLEEGNWSPACAEALQPYKSGGAVQYIEAGGMKPSEVLALSRKFKWKDKSGKIRPADIVIDYPDALNVTGRRSKDSYTMAIGETLDSFKSFCQRNENSCFLVWQTDKVTGKATSSSREKDPFKRAITLTVYDTMNSGYPNQKSNLFFILNGFRPVDKQSVQIVNPFTGEKETFENGASTSYMPVGLLSIGKSTFTAGGGYDVIWRDGARYELKTIPVSHRKDYAELFL